MTVGQWLKDSTKRLVSAGIDSARLDALILLEDALNKDRLQLLAHPQTPLQGASLQKLKARLKRRLSHEPLAYIRREVEFYGRQFYVDKRVMVPRPESETMIELLKQLVDSQQLTVNSRLQIADIGTGSGCLAITTKLEFPAAAVYGTDISPGALAVARRNARKLGADIKFLQGNLLEPLPTTHYPLFTILANLPYVPDRYKVNQAVLHEPRLAIFGGADGLGIYRQFWQQLAEFKLKPRFVLTESLPPQHPEMIKLAAARGYKLAKTEGLIQALAPSP